MANEERRWIVLADDGRHVTMGRHTDPDTEEIEKAGEALSRSGLGGWLAIMRGCYYRPGSPMTLMMVRELARPRSTWETAVRTFDAIRLETILPPPVLPREAPQPR